MREAGLEFDSVRVDLRTHKLADGGDFYAINSKGYVPVLELESGERLTEVPALLVRAAGLPLDTLSMGMIVVIMDPLKRSISR